MRASVLAMIGAALLVAGPPGDAWSAAHGAPPPPWHDVKCERYREAWSRALARQGTRGLSPAFIDAHGAFLASNCGRRADVCPRSAEELDLANTLVILSMNFGAASTFAPSSCR